MDITEKHHAQNSLNSCSLKDLWLWFMFWMEMQLEICYINAAQTWYLFLVFAHTHTQYQRSLWMVGWCFWMKKNGKEIKRKWSKTVFLQRHLETIHTNDGKMRFESIYLFCRWVVYCFGNTHATGPALTH